jgi:glutamyl-tRNA synthetase
MEKNNIILKYCLQNAVFYNGKADSGAVLGKVLAENPDLRKKVAETKTEIEKGVKEVNSLSPDEQKEMLKSIDKKLLVKEKREREGLPPLRGATKGRVVTRFAPSPTGPLSLPHLLRAAMLSYLYAKMYNGKFILRFEDTDPKNIKPEFYEWIKEDLKNTGIKPDRVSKESDNIELYYRLAEKLLKKGNLYVCTCSADEFRERKNSKQACECRDRSSEREWKKMMSGGYDEGEASIRFKTSMKDPNPALRDPVMFRVVSASHPLKKKRHHMWPLYNFASVVQDHEEGITHVFRGKEHEHNTTIQKMLNDTLGWKQPVIINFGMIYLPGKKIHTRDIVEWIKNKKVSGWDDPRLPTVRALLRRGFQPEAFQQAAIGCSLSKTDIQFTWDVLNGIDRKVLDSRANRYMVVIDPVRISLKNLPDVNDVKFIEEDLHPDFPKRGRKKMPVDVRNIYISRNDYRAQKGKTFRLKALGNFSLKGTTATYTGNEIEREMQKIQWVSTNRVNVKIVGPDEELRGTGEAAMKKLKQGDLIQMERVGFGRVDAVTRNMITVYFSHK